METSEPIYVYGTPEHVGFLLRARDSVPSYAWPGGYPIGYLCDDGDYLCGACVRDRSNPVHVGGDRDGWRLYGYDVLEGTPDDYGHEIYCAHCWCALVAFEPDTEGA